MSHLFAPKDRRRVDPALIDRALLDPAFLEPAVLEPAVLEPGVRVALPAAGAAPALGRLNGADLAEAGPDQAGPDRACRKEPAAGLVAPATHGAALSALAAAPPAAPDLPAHVHHRAAPRVTRLKHAGATIEVVELDLEYRPPLEQARQHFGCDVELHEWKTIDVTLEPAGGLPVTARMRIPRYRETKTRRGRGALVPASIDPKTRRHRNLEAVALALLRAGLSLRAVAQQTLLPREAVSQLLATTVAEERAWQTELGVSPEVIGLDVVHAQHRGARKRKLLLAVFRHVSPKLAYVGGLRALPAGTDRARLVAWLTELLGGLPEPTKLRAIALDGDTELRAAVIDALRRLAPFEPAFGRVVLAPDRWHAQRGLFLLASGVMAREMKRLKAGKRPTGVRRKKGFDAKAWRTGLARDRNLVKMRLPEAMACPKRRACLHALWERFPSVRAAYLLKELFCQVFDAQTPEEFARRLERFELWSQAPAFKSVGAHKKVQAAVETTRAWLRHHQDKLVAQAELSELAGEAVKLSTGPNETRNRMAKAIARTGSRQSLETFENLLLLRCGYRSAWLRQAPYEVRRTSAPRRAPASADAAALAEAPASAAPKRAQKPARGAAQPPARPGPVQADLFGSGQAATPPRPGRRKRRAPTKGPQHQPA